MAKNTIAYAMVFFAIWWAWMNFTWFASAYDVDDVPYRLATFVQIAGVLILSAGVQRAFDAKDFALIVAGYAVMRIGLVAQWLRAARGDAAGARTAHRFAIGVSACMVGWTLMLFVPEVWRLPVFIVMALAELAVPMWAERARNTPWHPHHIAERYGLFTLIVLGETVLAATTAIRAALDYQGGSMELATIALSALVIVFSMWWIYFGRNAARLLRSNREGFRWGYGHYFIFSSAAAVGAGLGVAVDWILHLGHVTATGAVAAVAVPVAVYLVAVWLVHVHPHRLGPLADGAFLVAAALVLLTMVLPPLVALPAIGVIVASLVAVTVRASL